MDILRGIAVLGILFANITAFSEPMILTQMPFEMRGLGIDDQWAHAIREVLISGKMRSLLAILFGVGLWLQFSKRKVYEDLAQSAYDNFIGPRVWGDRLKKKHWPGTYLKRTLLLAALGLCHGLFIWFGDILFTYALCALLAIVFVRLNDKVIFWFAAGSIGFGLFAGLGLSLLMGLTASSPESTKMWTDMPVLGLTAEINAYTNGGYLAQTIHRAAILLLNGFNLLFVVPPIFGLFMLGVLFGKRGTFVGGENADQDIRKMLLIGLGVGIPLNLLPIVMQLIGQPGKLTLAVEMGFAPILAVGILGLCLKVIPKLPGLITDPFMRVGKVALSCYILQSVLATALFYSWGFRLYDKLEWEGQLIATLVIILICVMAAAIWTRIFTIGPVEWAWRSLSEGKRLPWREPSVGTGVSQAS
jgi:uncharacterized protein